MQDDRLTRYTVRLESPVFTSFRCQKAANSLDIDAAKKAVHTFAIDADITTPYNVGLIVGASGSGKTTLAMQLFGDRCFDFDIDNGAPVIEQFPEAMAYDECAKALTGIGLSSVPCWIRPVATLSNGQRARAVAALQMARQDNFVVDEWTSVVDRTVGKAMSHALQRHARKVDRRVVALSCHYDVIDWLNPDWIIDCNKSTYVDRRLLWRRFTRAEQLTFDIREIDASSWRYFSKYHYLSDRLPGGHTRYFGVFHGDEQIGFQCFANYVPHVRGTRMKMHFNRTVIHPDYVGLGLGAQMINATSAIMVSRGFDVRGKFSSAPVYHSLSKISHVWRLENVARDSGARLSGSQNRKSGFRRHVKTYSFRYIGPAADACPH